MKPGAEGKTNMDGTPQSPDQTAPICDPSRCTGCCACLNACERDAISMAPDDEGFLRPAIDAEKCVRCCRCAKVCPQNTPPEVPDELNTAYACWHKDEAIRNKSSSGGAFTAIAEDILSRGGIVFGAAFDASNVVRHVRVESSAGLSRLRRSKYVQSDVGQVFREIRGVLAENKPVLFSGTPCQVDGLYAFLGKRHEGLLYTVDFACHGVNSPMIFADYMKWLGEKQGSPVRELEFRNKDHGWRRHEVVVSFADGTILRQGPYGNAFFKGFLKHVFLRPSCSQCRYANLAHPADITLADFWGYKGFSDIDHDDDKGVSAVIVNTSVGASLFEAAARQMEVFHRTPNDIAMYNAALRLPSEASPDRAAFWKDYGRLSFSDALVEKYLSARPDTTPPDRRKPAAKSRSVKKLVKRVLKALFGAQLCRFAKRMVKAGLRRVKRGKNKVVRFVRLRVVDRLELLWFMKAHRCAFVFVSPGHTNLGDNAQTLCIREFLEKWYPGRRVRFFTKDYIRETNCSVLSFVKKHCRRDALVFLHSGYRMSDVWPTSDELHRRVVETFGDRRVVSFPQTIHYTSEAAGEATRIAFNNHPDNVLMCRDAVSYEIAKGMFPKCRLLLVPDMVTSMIGRYHFNEKRSGILVCKRSDRESSCSGDDFMRIVAELSRIDAVTISDTYAKDSWKAMHRDLKGYLEDVWREFAKYRLVVTDRYHGTIFSLIAETPVLVFPSTDHKVRTGVDWFPESFSDYIKFVPQPSDLPSEALAMLSKTSRKPLEPYFLEKYFNAELFRAIES